MTKIFKTPFATQGDKTVVPVEIQSDGSVSYTQGYGYDYERDQVTDPAAKDIEREKMNSLFHDITESIGEMQLQGFAKWSEAGKPYPMRSVVYHKNKAWQSKIENNNVEPVAGNAWIELKADITANEVGAYSKGDADKRFQPVGKYQAEGYSYSKAETDTKYQPKGNYALAGNYANKGDSYTKAESEGKFQPKGSYQPSGNYATKGESYTKAESDSKYQGKGNYQAAGYSYSKSEADNKYQAKGNYVATTRKVNDKPLSGDVTITSQDIFNGQAISIGANQNLNNYKTAGIYFQPANANATTNLNYPEAMAGTLIVLKNAGITQLYYVYNTSRIYSRSQYGTGGFTPWAKEFNSQNKPTAGDVGAYSKGESDGKYQPKGNYLASGYSYSKGESDGKYQPKGNYLTSGYSYSKGESDNKYQPKGNYAIAGSSYTKAESDNRFAKYKVTGWKELYNGDWLSDNGVNINEDIRGKIVWVDLGGSQWTSFIMPPVDNIPMWCGHSDNNWCTFKTSNNGKRIHRAFGKGNTGIVRVFVAS